jgi:3-hydroxyacyl-[acyl-carrier-protein] dehydratase
MNIEEVKNILPHRPPMLLIDSVISLEPGKNIVAERAFPADWNVFEGHFPGAPVVPGVYLIETMAQAADILIMTVEKYAGLLPYLIGVNDVRFKDKVQPGDTVTVCAELVNEREDKAILTCRTSVYGGDRATTTGEVLLAMR